MLKNSLVILGLALLLCKQVYAEAEYQEHNSIYALINDMVASNIKAFEYEVSVVPLDSQLKLPKCTVPMEVFTAPGAIKPGRVSIVVRCRADKKWSIFVTSVIKVYENVIVLTRPVMRNELITDQYLTIEKKDVSKLNGDFATQMEQVEQKQAARYMPAGTILSLKSFIEPKLVKRGDRLVISAMQPNFAVRMNGIAMMDGAKGQLIRIKNENSGRIVSATVVEQGLVAVK